MWKSIHIEAVEYVGCPDCGSAVSASGNALTCRKCKRQYEVVDGVARMAYGLPPDRRLSAVKWDELYDGKLETGSYDDDYEEYVDRYYQDTFDQINAEKEIRDITYLEIGCGPFFMGQALADRCRLVIGVDFSASAIAIAKRMMEEKGIENYLLIQGDILHLPLMDGTVDCVYGGGVIEHFKETQTCVNELYRVLKKGGVSFNTVPYLNLGTIYRQVWGNIPNLPGLKQLAEFIHVTILRGRYMTFGYELSFRPRQMKKVHKRAGFSEVKADKFDVELVFEHVPRFMVRPLAWLAGNSRLFWPMMKVVGRK